MKHIVLVRLWFDDKNLLDRYLDVGMETFVPSIKAQTCKDFELGFLIKKEDVENVKERTGLEFTAYTDGIQKFKKHVLKQGYNIQTRHDIDDWMAPDYIEIIQKIYKENSGRFIIHFQPVQVNWPEGKEKELHRYHDKRISMFASLCQDKVRNMVFDVNHGQLWKLADRVFYIKKGHVKWVQHSASVTQTRRRLGPGTKRVGAITNLYDTTHNWISERDMSEKINILTRTFKRPKSFAVCHKSVMNQTYVKTNHIVGSEVYCEYYPRAIKLEPQVKTAKNKVPYNLHLNALAKHVKSGWIMYLDDDDMLADNTVVQQMVDAIDHEDQMLVWRVGCSNYLIPNDNCFGKVIKRGQITSMGFLFHSKHLPVPWDTQKAGDYRVAKYLSERLEIKWIDKIFARTQGTKNNHGKTPPWELPSYNNISDAAITGPVEPITKGLVTVGTPVWDNKNIYWLSIESLCRQQTNIPWELIVCECPSDNMIGPETLSSYRERLAQAGCQRVVYIRNSRRIDLSTKWIKIARRARGEILILHDSDDYTHPLRIQKTVELIGDKPWYETNNAYHYLIGSDKMITYDALSKSSWKSGFNIAVKTEVIRSIFDPGKNKGIHTWLMMHIKEKHTDKTLYPAFATTGANTVSLNRIRYFDKPSEPFHKTDKTLKDLGIDGWIIGKLRGMKIKSSVQALKDNKIEVIFIKSFLKQYKEGERTSLPIGAYKLLVQKGCCVPVDGIMQPIELEL